METEILYPEKNPFPYQATYSIEGTGFTSDYKDNQTALLPTLVLDPVAHTKEYALSYLNRYKMHSKNNGQILALRGSHGSGKTHAIRYVIKQLGNKKDDKTLDISVPFQIYVKAEGPNFLEIYTNILRQVPYNVIKELSLRFLGVVTSEAISEDTGNNEAGQKAAQDFRKNPLSVYKIFNKYLLEQGAVHERQAEEIERVAGGIDDFHHALSYLLSADLGQVAYNWLKGKKLSIDETKQIGVSGPISSPDMAKWGIQLLTTLFSRVGWPLVIYIDQYEKLVLTKDGTLNSQNTGRLHTLVEIIPRENGMLVFIGNNNAWDALPPDLQDRFASNIVEFPTLKYKEARDLIKLYLSFSHKDVNVDDVGVETEFVEEEDEGGDEDDIYPFTNESIKSILSYSGGNIRRLLQICSSVFDEAFKKKNIIERDLIERVIKKKRTKYFDRDIVTTQIVRMLLQNNLPVKKEYYFEQIPVDIAVMSPDGTPSLLINISESLFHNDEARSALESLNLVEKILAKGVPAKVILIVLGYVSPEVTNTVQQFVHEYLVYDPDSFKSKFMKIIEDTKEMTGAKIGELKKTDFFKKELLEFRNSLNKVLDSREADARDLEKRITQLLKEQAVSRISEKKEQIKLAWLDEKKHIEEKIKETRQAREKKYLDELENMRSKADRQRRRRYFFKTLLVASLVVLIIWLVIYFVFSSVMKNPGLIQDMINNPYKIHVFDRFFYSIYKMKGMVSLGFGLVVALSFFLYEYNIIGPVWRRELNEEVTSFKDFQYKIKSFMSKDLPIGQLIKDGNPQYRFLGAYAMSQMMNNNWDYLLHALETERSTLVRTGIANLITQCNQKLTEFPYAKVSDRAPEVVYIVEQAAKRGELPEDWEKTLSSRLKTMATIAGAALIREPNNLAQILAASQIINLGKYEVTIILSRAFEKGIESLSPDEVEQLRDSKIREAITELSPFEENGLGTFDELYYIKKIDLFYLFFRELEYFMERGL